MNRRRVGNVSVTLELMNKIVNSCKENLNLFIKDFFHIMNAVLSNNNFNNDVSIIELLELTFNSICTNLDGALCSGDMEFIRGYSTFVDSFFKLLTEKLHNDDLLLKCCHDISLTNSLPGNSKMNHFVARAVKFAIVKFQERNPTFKALSLTSSTQVPVQLLAKRLSRTQTRPAGFDLQNTANGDEPDISLRVIRAFFGTTETDKLRLSINALLDLLQLTPNKELLEFICNGIPVQLRYIVIILLVQQLSDISIPPTKNDDSQKNLKKADPLVILKLTSALLISDISIVGLSVLDIMRRLLKFQLDNYKNSEVVSQCALTIKDLNSKTYYKEQTSDMLYELVIRLKSTADNSARGTINQGISAKEKKRTDILTNNVSQLVKYTAQQCISLELFMELIPFTKHMVISLFNIVENELPSTLTFNKLLEGLFELPEEETQKILMEKIFEKYGKFALLSGLTFFLKNGKEPNSVYYFYHMEAAKFLQLDDYTNQVQYKRDTHSMFTKDDLLNYYSDPGSNKYSKIGSQLLLTKPTHVSTSDLISDTQGRTITPDVYSAKSISNGFLSEAMVKTRNDDKANNNITDDDQTPALATKTSIYRMVSDDIKSWRSMKSRTPKISDLKKAASRKKHSKEHTDKDTSHLGLGSQSVKSRVTNITFLLHELKTNNDGENDKVQDPDDDYVIGLDKAGMIRSQTAKLNSGNTISVRSARNSVLINSPSDRILGDIDDAFEDAPEDIAISTSRGKLFS